MKFLSIALCICFATCASVIAQGPMLYRRGTLDEIKGLRRVQVGPRNPREIPDMNAIENRLRGRHGLRIVRSGGTVDFFVNYMYARHADAPKGRPTEGMTASMRVVKPSGDMFVIVWARDLPNPPSGTAGAISLVTEFLKDLGELNRKK